MKINRRSFIKSMNWGLAGIIGMLGFGGCGKSETETLLEYGSPHADYTVKGKVVNKATKNPIEGIRVGYSCELCAVPEYGVLPTPYQPKAHVLTDSKGDFKLTDIFHAGEYQIIEKKPTLDVYVEDIDGEKNGLYQPEHLQVDFSKAVRTKPQKSWYEGEFTVTVDVELTEIENQ
jgi:putative lipoprotein (rSAM/lipoprotein system)